MAKDSLLRSHDHPAMSKTPTENTKIPRGKNGCFQNGFQPQKTIGQFNSLQLCCLSIWKGPAKIDIPRAASVVQKAPPPVKVEPTWWENWVFWAENGQVRKGLLYVFCLVEKYRLNWNHFKKRGIKHGHTNSILPVAVTRNIHRLKFTKEPWRTEKWSILNRQSTLPARPSRLWTWLSKYIAVEVPADYIDQTQARNLNCKREMWW